MAVNPIIECCSRELVPEYCQDLKSSVIYPVHLLFVKSVHGHLHRSPHPVP
jgi:hypothetical protein